MTFSSDLTEMVEKSFPSFDLRKTPSSFKEYISFYLWLEKPHFTQKSPLSSVKQQ